MFDRFFRQRSSGTGQQPKPAQPSAVQCSANELISLRLQSLPLKISRRPASRLLAGNHVSRFKGRGMDYLESRAYQPGDDIRNMDWRITARTGEPHVKLFQEERERPVMCLVDFSPSMFFASRGRFKSVIASQAAALLAWSTIRHGDRVGGILLGNQHHEVAPASGKRGALRLIREITRLADPPREQGATLDQFTRRFNDALQRLRRMSHPGSLVFLISDFYAANDQSQQLLTDIAHRCECVLLKVSDALESTPPPPGRYRITDGRQFRWLNTANNNQTAQYLSWFEQHQQLFQRLSEYPNILTAELTTDGDTIATLQSLLSRKALFRQENHSR